MDRLPLPSHHPGFTPRRLGRTHVLVALLAALVVSVLLTACGGDSGSSIEEVGSEPASTTGSTGNSGTGGGKGSLTFATSEYPTNFDLYATTTTVATYMWRSWWQYMVRPKQDGEGFEPELASSWKILGGGKKYVFDLRHGVKFSNGEALTSADVLFSWKNAFTKPTSTLTFLEPKIASMKAPDPYTVEVSFKEPWPYFLGEMANDMSAILPQQTVEKEGYAAFVKHPVGTGPFEISNVDPGSSVTVSANPDYWHKGYPKLESITFENVGDDTARAQAVEGGRAQLAEAPPPNQLASLEGNSAVQVFKFPNASVELIAMNTKMAPLDDQKVRQAISLAIDREGIVSAGLFGTAEPAKTFIVPPASYTYQETSKNLYPTDLEKAKELIAESGAKGPLEVKLAVSEGSVQGLIGQIVAEDLKQIGVTVKVERGQLASVEEGIGNETFQMATTNWQDYQPEPTIQPLFAIDPDYCCGAFFSGYHDPALVALTHKAIGASDEGERTSLFSQVQEEFADASYVLPLYNPMLTYVASPELKGFFAYPNNLFAFEEWSLE